MTQSDSSKILKLAALKPEENEPDTLIRNHDGTVLSVHNAPIIRALAKGLGVTFNIVMPEDNEYGYKKPDGKWTGIIGMLARGEADLSLGGLSVTNERREVVNFTYPLHVTDVTFMTDKPEPHTKNLFDALSFEVWIAIALSLILMSLSLYILLKKSVTFSTILLNCIGCLLEKSFSFRARKRHTALVLFHWFLGTTVLIYSYKAVILSVLTVPRMIGIRDISDLSKAAHDNSVMCMTHKGSVLWQYESTDERFKPISECLKRGETESLYNSDQIFLKYLNKKVFVAERIDISKYSRDYFISEDSFSLMHIAVAYSNQFCCPKKLQKIVHRIVEADIYPKMFRDKDFRAQLRQLKAKNDNYDDSQWKPLTLKDLTGAFFVLMIGHLCSLVIFVAEITTKTFLHSKS